MFHDKSRDKRHVLEVVLIKILKKTLLTIGLVATIVIKSQRLFNSDP